MLGVGEIISDPSNNTITTGHTTPIPVSITIRNPVNPTIPQIPRAPQTIVIIQGLTIIIPPLGVPLTPLDLIALSARIRAREILPLQVNFPDHRLYHRLKTSGHPIQPPYVTPRPTNFCATFAINLVISLHPALPKPPDNN